MSLPQTRSSSPDSDSSASSSRFSELSVATSRTEEHTPVAPHHLLVLSPPCDSASALDAFLRALPLCDSMSVKSYLLLALSREVVPASNSSATTLTKAVHATASVLGDDSIFKSWTCAQCFEAEYYVSTCDDEASALDVELEDQAVPSTEISHTDALNVFSSVGLHLVYHTPFSDPVGNSKGTLYTLERAPFSFPPLTPLSPGSDAANPFGPPTREEWRTLWAAWDLVTLGMIPTEMLHQKPIDLRHKCLFYIGHIPTFVNILLSRLLKEPYTEPKSYTQVFERGIDPHVDDPDHCHSHSEVPETDEDWPTLASILEYRDRVRARLMQVYDDIDAGRRTLTRSLARVLQMTLEHEGFHIETLLYMLIQRAGTGTLPPPGFSTPPWAALAVQWALAPLPTTPTVELGPAHVILGHDDCEADDASSPADSVSTHVFGWDNESPARTVEVARFRAEWRPVTNGEFYAFWRARRAEVGTPASWVEECESGDISIRTVYGAVPLSVAVHWPVLASYDQLSVYAHSKGGRLPTEPELRLFLDNHDAGFEHGANVGFRNWHPTPATAGLTDGTPASNGGVWEWTSTAFDGHPGLSPTQHFPGYSTDFFDGKHQVVLGASYATIPRLAGRRTVRNFYQHNYPYAWVGARVVYDVDVDVDVETSI